VAQKSSPARDLLKHCAEKPAFTGKMLLRSSQQLVHGSSSVVRYEGLASSQSMSNKCCSVVHRGDAGN
jgi:hypothetical protein